MPQFNQLTIDIARSNEWYVTAFKASQAVLHLNKRALYYTFKKYESPVELTSTLPFWLAKNGLRKIYPSIPDDQTTDFVVVGAGVTGAMIAQRLAEGGFSVVVVDRRDVCTGSTSASTAPLQYEIDVSLVWLGLLIGERQAKMAYALSSQSIDRIDRSSGDRV